MIVLITCLDYIRNSNGEPISINKIVYVSHGVNYHTDKNICLPCETLAYYIKHHGAEFNVDIGEWVIYD